MPQRLAHFIGGDNIAASGGEYLDSINPSDGSVAVQEAPVTGAALFFSVFQSRPWLFSTGCDGRQWFG